MAPIGGGMEHQTMTTLGFFNAPLIAHELGHQWWGDNVTCASWADIAMNEGFASYCEYIFHDHFEGHNSALYDIDRRQTDVKRYPGGIIYTPRDTTTGRVFDSRLTYNKGACALHTLRGIINNDAQFFTLLKNYQNRYANGNSMISTFQNETRATVGSIIGSIPIDTFFNQWYYAEGYPVYTMSWYQADTTLFLRIMQTTTVPASVSCFTLPIEFTLRSTSGDTLIRVENHLPDQRYQIPCTKRITSLIVDPNYWLIYDLLGITKDPTLALNSLSSSAPYLVSNPASTAWSIEQLPAGSAVNLYSLEGKLLWTGTAALHSINIPAEALPAGMYIAEIKNDAAPVRLKLVKTAQ